MDRQDRLSDLRRWLLEHDLDGVYLPRGDLFSGEEVQPADECLAWLTGFTGSAGMAVILKNRAAIFTDSRYMIQIKGEVDAALFTSHDLAVMSMGDWLDKYYPDISLKIGFFGQTMTVAKQEKYQSSSRHEWIALDKNPIAMIWHDRPEYSYRSVRILPNFIDDKQIKDRQKKAIAEMKAVGAKLHLITDPSIVNWLTGIRGYDLEFTPIYLAFCLLEASGKITLIADRPDDPLLPYPQMSFAKFSAYLASFQAQVILCDPASLPVYLHQILTDNQLNCCFQSDPLLAKKAIKSASEQDGFITAHRLDGLALCHFWYWLEHHGDLASLTESDITDQLRYFRGASPAYLHDSFATIAGYRDHAAIIHYRAQKGQDSRLNKSGVLLIDSGAHYQFGTTDITRCFFIGNADIPDDLCRASMAVLASHIELASSIFPIHTTGAELDAICRGVMQAKQMDYGHGTGHGVGYVLGVHEAPVSISKTCHLAIEAGQVLSNEPGFYKDGEFGIRYENLVLAVVAGGDHLQFQTLTCFPFDKQLIERTKLSPAHRQWLNDYHAFVFSQLAPSLDRNMVDWLAIKCAAL